MPRRILVCLEGSPSGERAVEMAIDVGGRLGATLVGLAIIDEPNIRAGAAAGIGAYSYKKARDEALVKDARERAAVWQRDFSDRCRHSNINAQVLELVGRPDEQILAQMPVHDLTFMGRHANFLFETAAQDNRTRTDVLHRSHKPVMVVPEGAPLDPSRSVLVAFDGTSAAKRAVRAFAGSGLASGQTIHVASVGDEGATAWEMANRGAEILGQAGIKATVHSVVSPRPTDEALLELRGKLRAHLIVMGAYASSRLSEMIWGSVTTALLEKTPVPLYMHH